ncbi:MAG TPA: PAS domain-containing protein [Lentimicrobium sp.]|nr:PAS domain-containing protein [Lentimicrobium sp.]
MEKGKANAGRVDDLLAFSLEMMNGGDGKVLIEKYKEAISTITPCDMLEMEDRQLRMGVSPDVIKKDIEKIINVFFHGLNAYPRRAPDEESFFFYLILENQAFTFRLNQVKKLLRSYHGRETTELESLSKLLHDAFTTFQEFEAHYQKKENILFPFLEKKLKCYRPLKVMWSLHDDIRSVLRELIAMTAEPAGWKSLNVLIGKYFSLVFRMIQKEDLIVFPVALEVLNKTDQADMHFQSFDYPFPFIEAPRPPVKLPGNNTTANPKAGESVADSYGIPELSSLLMLFDHLPVEITYVDENDRVAFFNKGLDRIFPRSSAVVGRLVQNCHPPESVHVVESIIREFRSGGKDRADFRIRMRGRYILIRYFAVRDRAGSYKGVLEVSQDITDVVSLEGEQRLLDWDSNGL